MLDIKEKMSDYLDVVNKSIAGCRTEKLDLLATERDKIAKMTATFHEKLTSTELFIPVIGVFSAGKSSILNSFLGNAFLPVAITPETAIPTELRYDLNQRIEAHSIDGTKKLFSINEMSSVRENAAQYKFVRMYLNNEQIHSIEPFILVDMPGFDSPLDAHYRAIEQYLAYGVHYLVLTSVEEGGLQKPALRRLNEINALRRRFSIGLTKTDLKIESDVAELKSHIVHQLTDQFNGNVIVHTLSKDQPEGFEKMLREINPEKVFFEFFIQDVKSYYFDIDGIFNTVIFAAQRTVKGNVEALEDLRNALRGMESERDKQIAHLVGLDARNKAEAVIKAITRKLERSEDELISAAKRGEAALTPVLNEIVRSALLVELQSVTDRMSKNAIEQFSQTAAQLPAGLTISGDWLLSLVETMKEHVLPSLLFPKEKSGNENAGFGLGLLIDGIEGIGAILSRLPIPIPIIKIASLILPPLIGVLWDKLKSGRQEEQIRQAVQDQLIPGVATQLRSDVEKFITDATKQIVTAIASAFEEQIKTQERVITEMTADQNINKETYDAALEIIKKSKDLISSCTNEFMNIEVNYAA